ncbi:hypothetical protein PflQ2_4471 [Pseudomonas fluorescens Q2-87]|uniref:Uncharacterized protein n=1 Tax=Pseudomonas fluorescens (strain Q2-87) TaxID=1038922 RepID=J2Y3L1_PSEFQ|nr:hypothetical protein PflQ2_4471 [Pseudomonas fluorescens Q2-87]
MARELAPARLRSNCQKPGPLRSPAGASSLATGVLCCMRSKVISPVNQPANNRQSFTLSQTGCMSIMARFHFPAREPPRCCVSAKKL